jgi:CubicO group peptidase (beta-lactamase class C family)
MLKTNIIIRKTSLLIFFLILQQVWAQPLAQDPAQLGISSDRLQQIDPMMASEIEAGQLMGAVTLVLREGNIVHFGTHGWQDYEAGIPMQQDTIFRIFSMTKLHTAVAVMMLLEEGKLLLTDPVSKYIPEFSNPKVLVPCTDTTEPCEGDYTLVDANREIQILDLLKHTSGISYIFSDRPFIADIYKDAGISDGLAATEGTIGSMVRKLATLPLYSQPGEQWEYGLSSDVLGYLVEILSGQSLNEFFQTKIFDPLGMVDTHFYLPEEKRGRLAVGYTLDGDDQLVPMGSGTLQIGTVTISADYHIDGPQTYYSGGGGLVSTARDQAKFYQMILNGGSYKGTQMLGNRTVALMTWDTIPEIDGPAPLKPGYGWSFLGSVHRQPGVSGVSANVGEISWGGIMYTTIRMDPTENMISMAFHQMFPLAHLTIADRFHHMAYQSIVDKPQVIRFKR